MCIVANKIPGVRAAPCHDDITAEMSRRHNDLNVLCLSGDLIGERLADRLVEIWLKTPFDGGRHARRNQKIADLERRNGAALRSQACRQSPPRSVSSTDPATYLSPT